MRRAATLIAAALTASGCLSTTPSTTGPAPSPTDLPRRGGEIVEVRGAEPQVLNPILGADVLSQNVANLIYASLLAVDPRTAEVRPNLGSWTVSSDGLTYSWTIAASANWSDGKPIVGQDYLTTVKAVARSKATVRKGNFVEIAGFADYRDGRATAIQGITVDPADPKKFSVRFVRVFCPALVQAFGAPLPTQVFGKYIADADVGTNIDAAPENAAPPVASGPFKFKEWRKRERVTLERNETYFRGAPYLDRYVYRVADVARAAELLRSGEVNLYQSLQPRDLETIRNDPLTVYRFPANGYTYIGWNVRSPTAPALAERRIRQALAYGADMDAAIRQLRLGEATRVVTHHPPSSWAYPDPTVLERYAFDPAKAEKLIREAGYARGADGIYVRDGKPLAFTLLTGGPGSATWDGLMQLSIEQYRSIGARVTQEVVSFEEQGRRLSLGQVEAWIVSLFLGVDPDPFTVWHSSQIPDPVKGSAGLNIGGFASPELDRAIEEGRTPANGDCSRAARKKSYETFNRILNEEQPYLFAFTENTLVVASNKLHGLEPGTFGIHWNIEKWWIER